MNCPGYLKPSNPRHTTCCRCGRGPEKHSTSEGDTVRQRNLLFERDITRKCAEGVADPTGLIQHAETRARTLSQEYVHHPELVQVGRDRIQDVREELADARNHLCWGLEEHLEDGHVRRWQIALRHIILAYQALED